MKRNDTGNLRKTTTNRYRHHCMCSYLCNQGYMSLFYNRLQQMFPSDVVTCLGKRDIIGVTFPPPQQHKLNVEDCNNISILKSSSLQHHDMKKK